MSKLAASTFEGAAPDVARMLLGCLLVHETPQGRTVGRIVETEAYAQTDAASHSFRGPTPRTRVMFGRGGLSYVYRSYGMHWCINVTCGPQGYGAATLLRALEPVEGVPLMAQRRGFGENYKITALCRGPGNLTRAMGIVGTDDGRDLLAREALRLEAGELKINEHVELTQRIGISRAKEVLWRFVVAGSPFVSGPRKRQAL